MNIEQIIELSKTIDTSLKGKICRAGVDINFKLGLQSFECLKKEIQGFSNCLKANDKFDDRVLKIKFNNVNFQIINEYREEEDKRDEELSSFCKELVKNKINLNKVFFLRLPAFVLNKKLDKNEYFIEENYAQHAPNFYKRRMILIEKVSSENGRQNSVFEIVKDYLSSSINLETITITKNTSTFSFKNKKEKFEQLRGMVRESSLGVFIMYEKDNENRDIPWIANNCLTLPRNMIPMPFNEVQEVNDITEPRQLLRMVVV
jgi:hypothetical protein